MQKPDLALYQDGVVVLQVPLDTFLVGKREGSSLGLAFEEFVVNQVFADELDVETRVLHSPDLAGFEWLERDWNLLIH